MCNVKSKYHAIVLPTIALFAFCLSNTSDAAEPLGIYTGFRNKEIIVMGFHEHLYGVWAFEMDTEKLIISGLEYNAWSGRVFAKDYYPHYTRKLWEKRFEIFNVEKIIGALNKSISWSKIANENNVKYHRKEIIDLGQGISIYFDVSETGKCSVVFKNDKWIFRDNTIELWLNFDNHNSNKDNVTDMLNSFNNYKERHQKYLVEEEKNRRLQLKKFDDEKKEKDRIDQLFR